MKRKYWWIIGGVLAVAVLAGGIALAYDPKVEVRAGERVECTYGHFVSEDIKTISVPRSEASQYGVKTTKIVCPEHAKAEQLYKEAQEAIAAGDLETAEKKLAEIVAVFPDFRQASSQLDQIADGKKPTPDGDSGGTASEDPDPGESPEPEQPSTPDDPDEPVGPVASLAAWTPEDIAGYKADKIISDVLSLSREYTPASGDRVDRLVIAVDQTISKDAAQDTIDRELKLNYDQNNKTLKVNGRSAWLGTNRTDTAVLAIVDGPVLVVLQFNTSETDPGKLTADLVKIAETLPR